MPVVYDHYHHKLNPSRFSVDRLVSTWRGVPLEVHVSSSPDKPHRYGEHGDYLRAEDFVEALSIFPQDTSIEVIVEAKMKEKAIEKLVKELREKYPHILKLLTYP